MIIKKKIKVLCFVLVIILFVGGMTGCDSTAERGEVKSAAQTSGRYLESDVPLPEKVMQAYDLVEMEDGSIRLSASGDGLNAAVWELNADGNTWNKLYDFVITEEMGYTAYIIGFELSPKGNGLVVVGYEEVGDENGRETKKKYYALDSNGGDTEIRSETGEYAYFPQCDRNGDFYILVVGFTINKINMQTGDMSIVIGSELEPSYFGFAGNILYAVTGAGEIIAYNTQNEEILPQDVLLSDSIEQSGMNVYLTTTSSKPLVFAGDGDEGTVFVCGGAGVFRSAQNGSVVEKIIEGSLTSLGKSNLGFQAMEITDNNDIYVVAQESGKSILLRYSYSKDVSTVPEQSLKVYALYENPELRQAMALYQKENPDISVTLETGVTGNDGVTISDAMRTLSTEIMAGKGPDLLFLDGMPIDSYIEKGLLTDISELVDTVNRKEGLYTKITASFAQHGKVYAVPLRFHMPVIVGQKESLENISNLQTLADETERLHRENPEKYVVNDSLNGVVMAELLYDACSFGWLQEDGTLDEEELKFFYTQLKRIYSLDERKVETSDFENDGDLLFLSGITTGGLEMYCDKSCLNFGTISTVKDLRILATTMADKENIGYKIMNDQIENTFRPSCIAAISSKSSKIEEASDFLEFLLGKAAQSVNQSNGMPVNKKGLRAVLLDATYEEDTIVSSYTDDPQKNMEMTIRRVTEEDYQMYLDKVNELQNPSLTNEIIREAVMEQVNDCLEGTTSIEEVVEYVMDRVNLYLAEG